MIAAAAALLLLAAQVDAIPTSVEELTGLDAAAIIERAEDALRGETAQMKATMKITTPRWERSVTFRSWDDRTGDRSFIRILDPRKDRGTGFLRIDQTLWTYLPRVERTTRIPPSMMLQPWMGSDFSNDDLARESSMVEDYEHRFLGARDLNGHRALGVELRPDPEAPVVWSRIEAWVAEETFAPVLFLYYDEPEPGTFEEIRRMAFEDVRPLQGRHVPHRWVMEPVDKPGHRTEVLLEDLVFDEPLDDGIFTHANLKRAEAVR